MPAKVSDPTGGGYPFPLQLKSPHGDLTGQVIKLTTQGLLAEFVGLKVQPGDSVELSFVLPGLNKIVTCAGRTIKFYSQWASLVPAPGGKPMGKIGHLVEVHFVDPGLDALTSISTFLKPETGRSK